jgi:hypothetical protein
MLYPQVSFVPSLSPSLLPHPEKEQKCVQQGLPLGNGIRVILLSSSELLGFSPMDATLFLLDPSGKTCREAKQAYVGAALPRPVRSL